eukprot:symbB.v1.2.021738.t2/scaffold1896.1/size96813/9
MQHKISGGRKRNSASEPMQVGLVPGEPLSPVSEWTSVKQDEVPTTPIVEGTRANSATPGVSTPEVTAPKPCRAFLSSPGGVSLADSNAPADDPDQELRKLFNGRPEEAADVLCGLKASAGNAPDQKAHRMFDKDRQHARAGDGMHAEQNRPLSSISTSAGPTPSPDGRTSPGFTPSSSAGGRRTAGKMRALQSDAGRDLSKALPTQVRKVFVGGIPQDMQQEELLQLFGEMAPVKKAWVQRYRDATKMKPTPTSHNHRGFGFVIFQDSSAVDLILGLDPGREGSGEIDFMQSVAGSEISKFIHTKDGRKLEVKRAISSSDMPNDGVRQPPDDLNPSKGRFQQTSPAAVPEQASHGPPQGSHVQRVEQGMTQQIPQNCGWPMAGVMQPPAVLAPAHPWPTTGGDGMQQMPQQVQQVVPAMAGVQMAAAMRSSGMVMPMPTMNWMQGAQPHPYAVPAGAPVVPMPSCGDGSQPSTMQPCFNSPTWPLPNGWQMQMQTAAPFTQPQPVVWHATNGQPTQFPIK